MLVDLIEVKTNEKEALKNFLKKIPLLSKVIQFNRGINDINLNEFMTRLDRNGYFFDENNNQIKAK